MESELFQYLNLGGDPPFNPAKWASEDASAAERGRPESAGVATCGDWCQVTVTVSSSTRTKGRTLWVSGSHRQTDAVALKARI